MRVLLVATCVGLAACGHEGVSATTQRWDCTRQQCAVDFLLTNHSAKRQQVTYALRAHGEVELLGREERRMKQTMPVNGRPTQVVTTAWVRD